ncbi:MAG: ferrous iron transport protein A [Oscillospiraceae bacterium]|nr:ferrous iron transport protein A [Oscillospiraceae bacterium]
MVKSKKMSKLFNLYERKRGTFKLTALPKISLLENLGLRNGTLVTTQNRYSFGGPVLLKVEGAYCVALGKDIAKQIYVEEV